MKTTILLAMHGIPPLDFPPDETMELFALHARLERSVGLEREGLEWRYAELDKRVRAWPRTEQNDPFYVASHELAAEMARQTGLEVRVGFNEFCGPNLSEALAQAVSGGATKIVVITPMMTRGGEHSEIDIPTTLDAARQRHPGVEIVYAWPFSTDAVGLFLAQQVQRFI